MVGFVALCQRMAKAGLVLGIVLAMPPLAQPGLAQSSADTGASTEAAIEAAVASAMAATSGKTSPDGSAPKTEAEVNEGDAKALKDCKPDVGCVTNLPLPRYVTLKGEEGNARRGPGLTHRIDWVFTRPGMPLKITAEYDNWRRVEDQDGAGGWVHYALLSGVRSALVISDMVELHSSPRSDAGVVAQAELGVVARILECDPDWCRISAQGEKGWVQKTALWGVDPGEVVQ